MLFDIHIGTWSPTRTWEGSDDGNQTSDTESARNAPKTNLERKEPMHETTLIPWQREHLFGAKLSTESKRIF